MLFRRLGQRESAETELAAALEILEALRSRDELTTERLGLLVVVAHNLGNGRYRESDWPAAETHYRIAYETAARLAHAHPENAVRQLSASETAGNLAAALSRMDRIQERPATCSTNPPRSRGATQIGARRC